jgi:hypothetical protein
VANPLAITPHASGAETASGIGASVDIGALRTAVRLLLDVTAISGTFATNQGLVVTLETSVSGAGGWQQIGAFGLKAGQGFVGFEELTFARCRRFVRARWAITGTGPSFTFSVSGAAHVLYAAPEDLGRYAIKDSALSSLSDAAKADALLRATADADAALNAAFTVPITAWGEDLRGRVADRAAFYALATRGFNPNSEADQIIVANGGLIMSDGTRTAVERWFQDVATGVYKPPEIVDSTPDVYEAGAFVVTNAKRGW